MKTDVGTVTALQGSAGYRNGIFTLKSRGYDFWTAPDDFLYVYQPFTGDGSITAKVESIQNTNKDALAGIMIRESGNVSSSYVATVVNPSNTIQMSRQGAGTPAYNLRLVQAVRLSGSDYKEAATPLPLPTLQMGSTG
jgi:hypothetical protein